MAVKGILFNTEMVQAILDGRKTCTRRVVKTRRKDACGFYVTKRPDGSFTGIYEYDEDERMFENQLIPPYKSGDILYVRETWERFECWNCEGDERGNCPKEPKKSVLDKACGCYMYRATDEISGDAKWHPSIHMPKEAARIWLKVTNVRVERLQDMTDDDAEAEGCFDYTSTALGFPDVWESTIKKSDLDRYGWDANPWVWVIEFERCEKTQEEHK
jgi:hypothetical protein